jgi:hypothetical protein
MAGHFSGERPPQFSFGSVGLRQDKMQRPPPQRKYMKIREIRVKVFVFNPCPSMFTRG